MTKKVKYTQPLLGEVNAAGYLILVPGAVVQILQDGDPVQVYSDEDGTEIDTPALPSGVASGTAGVSTRGELTVWLEPGSGYSGVSTVGQQATTFPIPDISPDVADLTAATTTRLANTRTADYTLVLTDAGKAVEVNAATGKNVTVPPNASVEFPVGTIIEIPQVGAGAATVVAGAGVTITGDTVTPGQGGSLLLRKTGTNAWWSAIWSVRSGTYAPTTGLLLRNPNHLRRWSVVLGDALGNVAKQPVLSCLGDSVTAGFIATDVVKAISDLTKADRLIFRERGWVGALRALLAARYGDSGEGFIFPSGVADLPVLVEDRVTRTGAYTSSGTVGPVGAGVTLGSGDAITFRTDRACTRLDIIGWWSDGVSAPWTGTLDGAVITGPTKSGADLMYTHSLTGLADEPHTLVIAGPGSLRADIGGVVARRGVGVVVNRMGRGSATTDTMAVTGFGTPSVHQDRGLNATFTQTATDLAIVMARYNDRDANMSKATFKANVQKMADVVVASGGCALLIPDPIGNPSGSPSVPDGDYLDAIREISDATDHVACADLERVWGTWPDSTAAGLVVDQVHPTSKGHGAIARMLFDVLTRTYTA